MHWYKQILGFFFIVAAMLMSMLAVLVVLDITTVAMAFDNGAKLIQVLSIVALASVIVAVVLNALRSK